MALPFTSKLRAASTFATAMAAAEAEVEAAFSGHMPVVAPASPFHTTDALQAVAWSDLMGADLGTVTREQAMTIPAVARHRHLVCGVVARSPLVRMMRDSKLTTPAWASRTDGELSPFHRMLWTADDLIFLGWSAWRATRIGSNGAELETAERIAPARWETDEVGRVKVDGEYISKEALILIPGPHEGILSFGAPTLRRTLDNLAAAANAARNPSAYLELHYTGEDDLPDTQVDALVERWAKARRGLNGGVSYTNKWLEVREHGTHEAHLLIEGRNADAVDAARLISNPAAMADATSSGASLTYETTEGRNDQFLEYGAGLYMDAIAARLSMDDVVAPLERMAFDTSANTAPDAPATGPTLED